MLVRVRKFGATRNQLRTVRCHAFATAFGIGGKGQVHIFKDHGVKRDPQLPHLVGNIALCGGSGLGANGFVLKVRKLSDTAVVSHHNALAVVEHHRRKGELIRRIAP